MITVIVENKNIFRPVSLSNFIGQTKLKQKLQYYIDSALARKEPMDHILFYGPPGTGKTTISQIISYEMHSNIRCVNGATIEKPSEIVTILTNLKKNDILFIDEIHRLPLCVEEILYSAMEDFKIDVLISGKEENKIMTIRLSKFTLVGATTLLGHISKPLQTRFSIIERLDYYKIDELNNILFKVAEGCNLKLIKDGAIEISKRSRNTPRIAINFLKRIRDFCLIKKISVINASVVLEVFDMLDIDSIGLNKDERKYIKMLALNFDNKSVGLETIMIYLGEDKYTIENNYEPYLIRIGFLIKTKNGRMLSEKGIKYAKLIK
ncbi:MAG: Holliday junction branch migration DNA helicase RuvB [Bacilli bacterium]|nr:Holliday junction branch migration DNA helicase RuvB [Bacilli bacterium]